MFLFFSDVTISGYKRGVPVLRALGVNVPMKLVRAHLRRLIDLNPL